MTDSPVNWMLMSVISNAGRRQPPLSTFDRCDASDCPSRAEERGARRGAGVGGERTHLDKCTIWHCSRENRRPCARAAADKRVRQSRAFAPQPAPVSAVTLSEWCRLARNTSVTAISAWRPFDVAFSNMQACGSYCLSIYSNVTR